MQSTKIAASFLLAAAMITAQPNLAQASYESQCKLERGSLNWDGVGLRWCCSRKLWSGPGHRVHRQILWCKS